VSSATIARQISPEGRVSLRLRHGAPRGWERPMVKSRRLLRTPIKRFTEALTDGCCRSVFLGLRLRNHTDSGVNWRLQLRVPIAGIPFLQNTHRAQASDREPIALS